MKVLPPLRAIRKYCLLCSNGLREEVRMCPCKTCPLRPYRFGVRPDVYKRRTGINPLD